MINWIKNIPITEDSYPLTRAYKNCCFDSRGYLEEEYFFSGTANVYETMSGKAVIKYENASYVNRFLVRRPADISKASGRVAVEILNATSGLDVDRTWVLCKEQMMREGDVYVGITSKPSSLRPLHKFDPERYQELFWSNPNPALLPQELIEPSEYSGTYEQDSEMGLIWDMLTDLSVEIHNGAAFLGGITAKYVYLIGWSQSCGYLIRYVDAFAETFYQKPFDGYFSAGGVRFKTLPLNQYEHSVLPGEKGHLFEKVSVPFIMMQTESENASFGNLYAHIPDSDAPDLMTRTYEVPGATHDNEYSMIKYYGDAEDEFKVGILLDYPGEEPYPNDYPYEFAFSAAYVHMCRWAEEGILPPRVRGIDLDFAHRNVRDRFGNATGGWRLPPIEYPVCTYYPHCTPLMPPTSPYSLFGVRFPFTEDRLVDLYGSLENYKVIVEASADQCIAQGFLLQADKDACVNYCLKEAAAFGLK